MTLRAVGSRHVDCFLPSSPPLNNSFFSFNTIQPQYPLHFSSYSSTPIELKRLRFVVEEMPRPCPRPGPRPYECVRRAWHSDRHQPFRGSLIQDIFRLVNEAHSSTTKKNKEWLDKLPVVVLKAEQIIYSKANSEAEYMDLQTLWDRTNDAISIIIRSDASAETGVLLHPCIEAALNLGCTPRRASRSQRSINSRSYLNPVRIVESSPQENVVANNMNVSHCLNLVKTATKETIDLSLGSGFPGAQNNKQCLPNSVYPLFYGNSFPQLCNHAASSEELSEMSIVQNLFLCNLDASRNATEKASTEIPECVCDLSLRLGPLLNQCAEVENSDILEVEDVGSHNSEKCNLKNSFFDIDVRKKKRKVLPPTHLVGNL